MSELPENVKHFIRSKPPKAAALFLHFYECFSNLGEIDLEVTKTTVAFGKTGRYCYIYQFGKDFVSGVLRLGQLYDEPTVFFKTRAVSSKTFAHHFRLYEKEDVNKIMKEYMKLAIQGNSETED